MECTRSIRRFYRDAPEIIFVSHDASVTGAPILMLSLLAWWRSSGGGPFRVILRHGGTLEPRFREFGRVWNLNWPGKRVYPDPTSQQDLLSFCGPGVRLIYANTGAVGDVLEALEPLGVPVLAHIHELETMLSRGIGRERFDLVKQRATRFVVPSRAVAANLIENHGISADMMDLVPEYLPDDYANDWSAAPRGTEAPRMIFGAGTLDWRKGPDLFVQVAAQVRKSCSHDVRFVWAGAPTEVGQKEALHELAVTHGVGDVLTFVGEKSDLRPYFREADVMVSSSREDPYPVVCLEAAAHGVPVVCFDGAGGMPEFVQGDAGRVVPHLDVAAMAAAILSLLVDPAARQSAGRCARARIESGHRISICGSRLRDIATRLMGMAQGVDT
ncbi:MAG: glycosyltransferase [Opitutaceae bacterium]|nr:glycosyltransferase [Opitutaceae bacterium]